jgi:hypothetical protein
VADGGFGRDAPPCARATRVTYRAHARLAKTTQASEKSSPSSNVRVVPARRIVPSPPDGRQEIWPKDQEFCLFCRYRLPLRAREAVRYSLLDVTS